MGIIALHPIVQKFVDAVTFAKDHFFAFIDLRLVAIGQAQIEIDSLDPEVKDEVYKNFQYALVQLEHMGLIHKFENIQDGFKIYPQDREYIDENHLYLYFTKEQKNDIA